MKKVLRFVLHNRKTIIKAILKLIIAVIVYHFAHEIATAMRGYEAIGGEIFVPLLVLFAEDIWGMIKAPFKAVNKID